MNVLDLQPLGFDSSDRLHRDGKVTLNGSRLGQCLTNYYLFGSSMHNIDGGYKHNSLQIRSDPAFEAARQ